MQITQSHFNILENLLSEIKLYKEPKEEPTEKLKEEPTEKPKEEPKELLT